MSELRAFYFNNQLRRYLVQFMAVFGGMQVEVGATATREKALISVPIIYGSRDRVVAALKAENTQNKPVRLPTMSAYLSSIDIAPELRKGIGTERRQAFLKTGGLFPDDISVVHQLMPIPYRATIELGIFTSNTLHHHQLLEQILMLFDPILQIQSSDDPFDWTKITTIELVGVRLEENYPPGTDRRIIQTFFDFQLTVYMSAPAQVRKDYIKDIYVRVGAVSNVSFDSGNSFDIIAELDVQGIPYDKIFSLDDVEIDT